MQDPLDDDGGEESKASDPNESTDDNEPAATDTTISPIEADALGPTDGVELPDQAISVVTDGPTPVDGEAPEDENSKDE